MNCMFADEISLPKAVTICLRDTFVKRDVDHYSKELYKSITDVEAVILKS